MSALRKVLVVDDDPVVGTSFNRVLTNKGYQVIQAHDAHEALAKLRQEAVDLVYTDIRMPGMNGLELAEQLKSRRPWTPVVIITGYGNDADEERAFASGVSGFLHKPLSPEMIEDSAADALRGAPVAMPPDAASAPAVATAEAVVPRGSWLRNVALFLAAPFIGLVYAVFLPPIGLAVLVWMAGRALLSRKPD